MSGMTPRVMVLDASCHEIGGQAEVLAEERSMLSELMSAWRQKFPEVEVRDFLMPGHPISVLSAAAEEAQLLVVGSHGRGSIRSLVLGSVSHGVLHHASGAVTVIRPLS